MTAPLTEPKVVVSARIDREQLEALERMEVEQERSVSWLVRQAVDRYLHEPTRPKP